MYYTSRKITLLGILLIVGSCLTAFAQSSGDGYNPDNPSDPGNPGTLLNYTVQVQANMAGAGTVTGAGVYRNGTNVSIKATTNAGYKFIHWLKNEEASPYNTSAQFTHTVAMEDVSFTAVYEKLKTITVTKNHDAAGTVSGGGSYQTGNTVTLRAAVNKYYTFLYWKKDNSDVPYSTDAICTYTVEDDDVTFTAVHKCPPTVTVASNDASAGTVKYEYSYNVTSIEYVPKDVTVGTSTYDSYYYPFYNYQKYSTTQTIYTKSEVGSAGRIKSISYYVNTASSYTCDIKIYMAHKSATTFSSASDGVPYNNMVLVYSNSSAIIGRSTGWETYTLDSPFEYNGVDNLVVIVCKSGNTTNSTLKYRYTSVSNSCLSRANTSESYANPSSTNSYTRGSSKSNAKFNIDQKIITYGTDIVANITATPASKYRFIHWLRNDETEPYSTEATFEYPLADEDVRFTAVFRWNPDNPGDPSDPEGISKHNLTVGINNEAAGIVAGAGRYQPNKNVTISTSANAGYRFLHWLKDDDDTPYKTTASFTYTMGIEDVSFTAVYEEIPPEPEPVIPDSHILYIVPETAGSCTFSMASGTSIVEEETFSVTVTPGPEQQFLGWYQNGVFVASTLTYASYMGTEDITLVAKCKYLPESPDDPNNPGGFIPNVISGVKGDVNDDGDVTVADAVAVIDYYLHWTAPSDGDKQYDVNEDGSVTVADAVEVLNIYLNKQ